MLLVSILSPVKNIQAGDIDKTKARQLRRNMTTAEVVLWQYLRKGQMGFRFRRQYPVGPYILDFYCYELNLCIELDGDVHQEFGVETHDEIRTRYLNSLGITVLRYSNKTVFLNVDGILDSIENFAAQPVLMRGWHKDEYVQK